MSEAFLLFKFAWYWIVSITFGRLRYTGLKDSPGQDFLPRRLQPAGRVV